MLEQVVAQHNVKRSKIYVGSRSHAECHVLEALAFRPFFCSIDMGRLDVYPENGMNDLGRRDCVRPQTRTQVEKATLLQRPLQLRIEQGERVFNVLRTGDAAPLSPLASP